MRTKLFSNPAQIYATAEPQAQEECFFESGGARDHGSLDRRARDVLLECIAAGETNCFGRFGCRYQHRVRIRAEAKIWLPRPVLQIMPRFKSGAREVRDLILRHPRRIETFARHPI